MFLDIAIGIIAAIGVSELFDKSLSPLFLVGSIAFALLVDIDYLFYLSYDGDQKYAHRHRDLLHYPLLYIPIGMITLFFASAQWVLLFGITSFLHFLHDSIGIGWGIKWLWPFSKRNFKLFSQKDGQLSLWHHVSWSPQELDEVATQRGDPHWFRNIYLRWHPYAIAEFVSFLIALIILYLYLFV